MLLSEIVNKRAAELQLLLGGGLARIKKLVQAWHRWRKGGHGFIRIMLLNFTVRFENSRPFPSTLCRDEARARGSGLKQKCNRNLYHMPRHLFA